MANEELKEKVSEFAVENFRNGLNCPEAVFDALHRAGLLDVPHECIRMASGFGGGIGLTGNACGALSGAIMSIGVVHGRMDPYSVDGSIRGQQMAEQVYRVFNNMTNDFIKENGCLSCKELGSQFADWHCKERRKMCLKLVASTAARAVDYILMDKETAAALPYRSNMAGKE